MPHKQHNMDFGTIGNRACELSLNKILIEEDNPKVTRLITYRYLTFKKGLHKLARGLKGDHAFCKHMLEIWKQNQLNLFQISRNNNPSISQDCYTHLNCCMVAEFRDTLRQNGLVK